VESGSKSPSESPHQSSRNHGVHHPDLFEGGFSQHNVLLNLIFYVFDRTKYFTLTVEEEHIVRDGEGPPNMYVDTSYYY
jgi:hypothetical protein